MNKNEIITNYNKIKKLWEKHLQDKEVKLPNLYYNGNFSKDALVLIKLFIGYPNTKEVSKTELTDFVRQFYPNTKDVQQGRHLGKQNGFAIGSGRRGDFIEENISNDCYKLISLEYPHPNFNPDRRKGFEGDFEEIKKQYNYRCATCGSKEGENHLIDTGTIVQLQQGHMNPILPLEEGNIIPQCQICNRADRDRWVYDNNGRVVEIAQTEDGIRRVKDFLDNALPETIKIIKDYIKNK